MCSRWQQIVFLAMRCAERSRIDTHLLIQVVGNGAAAMCASIRGVFL